MNNINFAHLDSVSGLPVFDISQSTIAGMIKSDIAMRPLHYTEQHPGNAAQWEDGCTWDGVHIHSETSGSVTKYAIHATASTCGGGDCKLVAYELTTGDGGTLYIPELEDFPMGGGTTDTCTGNPCSSCYFTYSSGTISGCGCSGGTGSCNHSVSHSSVL